MIQLSQARRFSLAIGAVLMMFGILFGSLPAMGATQAKAATPSPAPTNISQLLIKGTVKNEGVGVAGVKFHVTGNGVDLTATSGTDGKWQLVMQEKGVYKVEIVLDSLPKGVGLRDASLTSRDADLTVTDTAAVLFPLGKDIRVVQPIGDQIIIRVFAGLNLGLLLAVAAIGISLIFGTTGLNNFAHGEMVTFGALFMYLFYAVLGWPVILAAAITIALSAVFGWSQDAAIWRPLRKRRTGLNQMMIVSIGLSIVLRYLLLLFFGGETKTINPTFESVEIGPILTTVNSLTSMGISAVALAGVALFLTRTRIGKATRAVSDNAALAASTGIDVERIIRIVWILAGALTGLAGILYGMQFQGNWLMGFSILLLLFASVTLGGLGTALGATVGALIIGMVVEVSSLVLPTDLKYAASLIILILVLLVRPQGVLGKKQRIG